MRALDALLAKSRRDGVVAIALFCVMALSVTNTVARQPADYVNPFIGTQGTGHTHPGASVPFGMVAPGPDNAERGWDLAGGYQYRNPVIQGFSNTHISGAGIPELGDILLQPTVGTPWQWDTGDFAAAYDKASERAEAGYYAVTLPAHGVRVALTTTDKVALQRYTFTHGGKVQVLLDLQHGLAYVTTPRVLEASISHDDALGNIEGTLHVRNWVDRQVAFALHFDHPVVSRFILPPKDGDKAQRQVLTFDLGKSKVLEVRVALSTVDTEGAKQNLATARHLRFNQVRLNAKASWNTLLSRVLIQAPERQKTIFYTALYHALLHPSHIADANGLVRGPDGVVRQARGGVYDSTLSLWDTYRAQFPLLALLVPEHVDGIVQSMLQHDQALGTLPVWTAWGQETWCMTGDPSLPILGTAVAYGFTGFDHREALAAMIQTATHNRPAAPEWAQVNHAMLDRYGYLPFDLKPNESVSTTLELGIGDSAVASVARALGDDTHAAFFAQRALSYQHLFDPETRLMRGKDSQGNWRSHFDAVTPTSPLSNPGDYTEGNAWQYSLTPALQDPEGLVSLMGGEAAFGGWLDRFFSLNTLKPNPMLGQEAIIGQYAHGNEPSHHIAWLYAYTPTPWHGHERLREIYTRFYSDQPEGIIGNDDAGQMSAWYVLATLGFYPVAPASGQFVLGAPQVKSARVDFGEGKILTIKASALDATHMWAKSVQLNGAVLSGRTVRYQDLKAGGTLQFEMRVLQASELGYPEATR